MSNENELKKAANDKPRDEGQLAVDSSKVEEHLDEAINARKLTGWTKYVFFALAAFASLFHLYILNFAPMEPWLFRNAHLLFGTVLGLMLFPGWRSKSNKIPI